MLVSTLRLAALFLVSIALLAYELIIMRLFAVASWSNFGSMVISIALLGFGLAGTLLTFMRERVRQSPDAWLFLTSIFLGPYMGISAALAQWIPFKPLLIAADRSQLWWIAAYYLLYSLPFFIGALFIGVCFIAFSGKVHRLYFWNMLGSGLGGFLVLAAMTLLPPEHLLAPLLLLTAVAALLCTVQFSSLSRRFFISFRRGLAAIMLTALSLLLVLSGPNIRVSEFKPISYARAFPDVRPVYHAYGPTGEYHVFRSSFFHFAPGLSDNASSNLKEMPRDAFLGLYIDGDGPIGIIRRLQSSEQGYIDYLPMSAPYRILKRPDVLLLKLGGGMGVSTALHHESRSVTVVESNPALIRLLRDVDFFRRYNGDLLHDPRVTIVEAEPRSFSRGSAPLYDLVEISLIDSVGLSQTGGYPIEENYTYTAQGIAQYMRCLKADGILSITVWNRINPPRNVPKLLATVVESLRDQGIQDPERRIFVFNLLFSTATILVKSSPFKEAEVEALQGFCRRMSFETNYYPGMPGIDKDFPSILKDYEALFAVPASEGTTLLPGDLYHFSLRWMLSGRSEDLYRSYVFNIRPATDDRPYYTAYLKPGRIPSYLKHLKEVSEEWGYLMLMGTLLQSLLFGSLVILLPILLRRRDLIHGRQGLFQIIVYYACLGLGYIMVEIFLMQRLVFFLANPIFSNSVVITAMLVISGFGSLFAQRFADRRRAVRIAAAGIGASLLFYLFGLSPVLDGLLGLPLAFKFPLAVLLVAPAAFFLGIPFPSGLAALSEHRDSLLPWAWGMNGALSVTGSVLCRALSISWGFPLVLLVCLALYLVVLWAFPANELSSGPCPAAGKIPGEPGER